MNENKVGFLGRNAIYLVLLVWLGMMFFYGNPFKVQVQPLPYSEFLQQLEAENVSDLVVSTHRIQGKFVQPPAPEKVNFSTVRMQGDDQLITRLTEKNIKFTVKDENTFWSNALSWLLPFILLIGFWYFIFNRMARTAKGGFMSLGKSRAKIYVERDIKTRFSDVAGVDTAKEELMEVVDFLKHPDKYTRLGGHTPKGILLVGPTGTGKTLLARAVAGESQVPFYSINGSEFVEMFVGLGAARVRDLFEQARKSAPCIIFIDELDALGKSRALGLVGSGGTDEKEQTLNQLLAELDGFDPTEGVVLLAATNRPEVLDPALLRAGRFDRQVLVDNPDRAGREAILAVHTKKIVLKEGVDLKTVASMTAGFSGADLANLVNEATLVATRRNADAVEEQDFTAAIERLVAGLERKKKLINPQERKRVAYHEMGHATVGLALHAEDKVHKVSIIPRGIGALGYTIQRPTEDRYLMAKGELITKIAVLLGGRAAEELFFDDVSTGAGDDLVKASDMARAMVTQFGMSEKLGLATFEKPSTPFLGGATGMMTPSPLSEETSRVIDEEVKGFLDKAYTLARKTLGENKKFIEKGVEHLLDKETLDENQIAEMWEQLGHSPSTPQGKSPEL